MYFAVTFNIFAEKKKHKPLVPNVGLGVKDPTLDLAAHEADLNLIDRIADIRKSLHVSEFLHSASEAPNERFVVSWIALL